MSNLRKAAQNVVDVWNRYGTAKSLRGWMGILEAVLAESEQDVPETDCENMEPVAWMRPDETLCVVREVAEDEGYQPLYTHPPRREWRSLTDEEIKTAVGASEDFWATSALWIKSVARAIEAALRRKNHG